MASTSGVGRTDEMSFVLDDVLFEVYPPQKTYYSDGETISVIQ